MIVYNYDYIDILYTQTIHTYILYYMNIYIMLYLNYLLVKKRLTIHIKLYYYYIEEEEEELNILHTSTHVAEMSWLSLVEIDNNNNE